MVTHVMGNNVGSSVIFVSHSDLCVLWRGLYPTASVGSRNALHVVGAGGSATYIVRIHNIVNMEKMWWVHNV